MSAAPHILTPAQIAALSDVQIARAALDALKAAHAVQIQEVSQKIDAAVVRAAVAGVPMSRIAHEGLRTTHRNAAYAAIARVEAGQ